MKSRVKRHHDLYKTLNTDAESSVQNSNLSQFADRLNDIDKQFEKIDVVDTNRNEGARARRSRIAKDTIQQPVSHSEFDTFENEYLKDFLEEVKAYNVKKGYRNLDNTDANILAELRQERKIKARISDDDIEAMIRDVSEPTLERDSIDDGETRHFEAVSEDRTTSFDETIATAVQEMGLYDTETMYQETTDTGEEQEDVEEDNDDEEYLDSDDDTLEITFEDETLEEQLQAKDDELNELNNTYLRTGRLLNVAIILLVFAVIVIAIVIAMPFIRSALRI